MVNKIDFIGNCVLNEETYPADREQLDDMISGLVDQMQSMDSLSLIMVGRKGMNVHVEHLLMNPNRDQRFVEARLKSAVIELPNNNEVFEFMETARALLHVDVYTDLPDMVGQTLLDIGNSEGEGHSLSFIDDLENNDD